MSATDHIEVHDVPAAGIVSAEVAVPRWRTVGAACATFGLGGADSLTAVVEGSDDRTIWRTLATLGPLDAFDQAQASLVHPPAWLRMRITVAAPVDWIGRAGASLGLLEAMDTEPAARAVAAAFHARYFAGYPDAQYDGAYLGGRMLPFRTEGSI